VTVTVEDLKRNVIIDHKPLGVASFERGSNFRTPMPPGTYRVTVEANVLGKREC
jgi:hypothetical protein